MPFVHVKALDFVVAQCLQHPDSAYAQHRLLAKPVTQVAAVEMIGESSIRCGILFDIRIQKINRHAGAANAFDFVLPCPHQNLPPLDLD